MAGQPHCTICGDPFKVNFRNRSRTKNRQRVCRRQECREVAHPLAQGRYRANCRDSALSPPAGVGKRRPRAVIVPPAPGFIAPDTLAFLIRLESHRIAALLVIAFQAAIAAAGSQARIQ